jgi:hypothetical protein
MPPKPLVPISAETSQAIQIAKVRKRSFTAEERKEILALDAQSERLAIVPHRFHTSIPEIHRVVMTGMPTRRSHAGVVRERSTRSAIQA